MIMIKNDQKFGLAIDLQVIEIPVADQSVAGTHSKAHPQFHLRGVEEICETQIHTKYGSVTSLVAIEVDMTIATNQLNWKADPISSSPFLSS